MTNFVTETEVGTYLAQMINARFNAFLFNLAEREGIPFDWMSKDAREILRDAEIEQPKP